MVQIVGQIIILGPATAIFIIWLMRTNFGTSALLDSRRRPTVMPFYVPIAVFVIWLTLFMGFFLLATRGQIPQWQEMFYMNVALGAAAIIGVIIMLCVARRFFARRLRGMGLWPADIGTDMAGAFVKLYAVWPILLGVVLLTNYIATRIYGPEWQMQEHEQIRVLLEHDQIMLRVALIAVTAIIVPVFEEMLFRGLVQTKLRSYMHMPWGSIIVASVIFTAVHTDISHWPALFMLSVCMGYAYEKSGSLWQPIFIHVYFNAFSLTMALNFHETLACLP